MDRIPPHLQQLIRDRNVDADLLLAVTETSSRRFSLDASKRLLERNPDDHRVRLAEAFEMLCRRDSKTAAEVLGDILDHHPEFAVAHAMYGQALAAENRWDDLNEWFVEAPPDCPQYADYWLTLGNWSEQNDQPAEASRAYWEATRRDPINIAAFDRLAQSLRRLRETDTEFEVAVSQEDVDAIQNRAVDLFDFRDKFNHFERGDQTSQSKATQVAEALFRLGRHWEAEAWSAVGTQLTGDRTDELAGLRKKILLQLARDSSWYPKDAPIFAIDLSSLPLPKLNASETTASRRISSRNSVVPVRALPDHPSLSEESDRWGLTGIGANNNPAGARSAAIIRFAGVGGGAIDYDLDGLPDLLVMGAGGEMLKQDSTPNDLMRNHGDRFIKVTQLAGVGDRGFGQGVAVGDFNEDGFPDLYYGNLGKNRLLRNNGDGSFSDCTSQLRDGDAAAWSTCGVFVDINEDGVTDLLSTNYCQIVPGLDEPCESETGVQGPCYPLMFPAEADQFFVGAGDGTLKDATAQWIATTSKGRGLGILAGTIDGSSLGVFVANDMSRNAYYRRASRQSDGKPSSKSMELQDQAAVRGVAVDGRSLAQASMGIASSDFDQDGDLDLYVTGFGAEYNIYYEQVSPGMWRDETSKLDLVQPTLAHVGFGTEAIDLDSDGLDEIIVTNGHIGDMPDPESLPFEQPLQLFRRGSSGRFELLDDDSWGDYFRTPHVGRALWTVDVNRDGRNDVMISHDNEHVCLLVNRSEDQNHRVGFKLVGTRNSRDAVGAIVRLESDGRSRTLWALAGDGDMCSNERILRAGLGEANRVENVSVTWQDGTVDQIGSLDVDAEYVIVQGENSAFRLARYRSD